MLLSELYQSVDRTFRYLCICTHDVPGERVACVRYSQVFPVTASVSLVDSHVGLLK